MCDNQIEQQVSIWWKIISKCNLSLPFDFIVYTSPLGIATVNGRTCNAHNHRTYQPKKKKNNDHKIWLACIMCECISSRLQSLMLCATFAFFAIWHPVQTHAQTHKRMQSSYSHALCFCERIRLFSYAIYIYIYVMHGAHESSVCCRPSPRCILCTMAFLYVPIRPSRRRSGWWATRSTNRPTVRVHRNRSAQPRRLGYSIHTLCCSANFMKYSLSAEWIRKAQIMRSAYQMRFALFLPDDNFHIFCAELVWFCFSKLKCLHFFFVCVRCCCRGHSPTSGRCARMATYCYRTRYSSPSRHDSRKK